MYSTINILGHSLTENMKLMMIVADMHNKCHL